MPVMPSPARKQKIVRVLFKKRAIELQTAVKALHFSATAYPSACVLVPHFEVGDRICG